MIAEESEHRRKLSELYRARFGEHITMIRRQDVKGFLQRKPIWLTKSLSLDRVRKEASSMELETRTFYERSAAKTTDVATRQLLTDLAEAEREHIHTAEQLSQEHLTPDVARAGGQGAAAAVRAAGHPAGAGRADGWQRFHPGAAVCRGLCDEQ